MGFGGLIDAVFCEAVDLLTQLVLLQQVVEGQDGRFIRDPLSLISSIPANRRMVGTSISASSIAGSLSEYLCCRRWIRSMVANG